MTRWTSHAARQMDYWVTAGSYPEIMREYARATGMPPLMPDSIAGFWQCKLRYKTQDELLAVAREHKERGDPDHASTLLRFSGRSGLRGRSGRVPIRSRASRRSRDRGGGALPLGLPARGGEVPMLDREDSPGGQTVEASPARPDSAHSDGAKP
jgi:hypothetical protein